MKLSFVTLTIANLGTIVSFLSGLYDRRFKYVRWDSIFIKKTILSALLLLLGLICWLIFWGSTKWIAVPLSSNIVELIEFTYILLLIFALPALTIALGYYGLILSYGRYGGKTSYKPDLSREIKLEPPDVEIEGWYCDE